MRSHRPEHNHHLFIKVFTSRLVRMAQGMHSQRSVVRESLTAIHTDVWLTPPHLHFMATHVRSQCVLVYEPHAARLTEVRLLPLMHVEVQRQ
jgi:hypothetical protein